MPFPKRLHLIKTIVYPHLLLGNSSGSSTSGTDAYRPDAKTLKASSQLHIPYLNQYATSTVSVAIASLYEVAILTVPFQSNPGDICRSECAYGACHRLYLVHRDACDAFRHDRGLRSNTNGGYNDGEEPSHLRTDGNS